MAAGQPTLQFLPARRLFPVVRAISPLSRRDYLIIFNCQSCRARGRLAPGANDRRYGLRALLVPSLQVSRGNFEKYASERIAAIPLLSAVIYEFTSFWRRK